MGSPAIFKGNRTKLLTQKGLLLNDGTAIDNDGVVNYIKRGSPVDGLTTGWVGGTDSGSRPTDGTGGATPTTTWTVSSTNPLNENYSFIWTKDAANRQGEFFSYDFTIKRRHRFSVLQLDIINELVSGTYDNGTSTTDSDLIAYIYDVTNGALIEPVPFKIQLGVAGINVAQQPMEFQTTDSLSYRLIIYTATTSTSAYTVKFDNISVSKYSKVNGSVDTLMQSVSGVTCSWVTNTTLTAMSRRVGDHEEYRVKVATSGAPTATALIITLPRSIDTAKLTASDSGAYNKLGDGTCVNFGVDVNDASVSYNSSNSVAVWAVNAAGTYSSTASAVTDTVPFTFGNTDYVEVTFKVPIVGWSSNAIMSSDAAISSVAVKAYLGTPQTDLAPNASTDVIDLASISKDSIGMWNVSLKRADILVSGWYEFDGGASIGSTNVLTNVYIPAILIDGSAASYGTTYNATGTGFRCEAMWRGYLVRGQYVQLGLFGAGNNSVNQLTVNAGEGDTWLYGAMRQSPQQIAASETVCARYTSSGGQSISTGNVDVLTNLTKDYDSHSAMNATTGVYTVPVSGEYETEMTSISNSVAVTAASNAFTIGKVTGTKTASGPAYPIWATTSMYLTASVKTKNKYLAGDTISFSIGNYSGSTYTTTSSGTDNHITITKVGNY